MKPGLLIIDMQEKYTDNLPQLDMIVQAQVNLIRHFRNQNYLIGLIESDPMARGPTIEPIKKELPLDQTPTYFETVKSWESLFKKADKIQLVKEKMVETQTTDLVIAGVNIIPCILSTMRDAKALNISPIKTALDMVGQTRTPDISKYEEMLRECARVYTTHKDLLRSLSN